MAHNGGSGGNKSGSRNLFTRVKTARGRKASSKRWLERQLNDPYVARAKEDGYRSRAAYKILEIDEKFRFLTKGKVVVDLGAAPGGWTQVAIDKTKAGTPGGGLVVGIDLQEIEPISGATLFQADFTEEHALGLLEQALNGRNVDIVLSDMAAPACGHTQTDHLRIIYLCELAFDFAIHHLSEGGVLVAKILRGGTEHDLLKQMQSYFKSVKHFKPPSSRADSAEMFVVAQGFHKPEAQDV